MYIREKIINRNVAHGSLRDKFVRNIKKVIVIKEIREEKDSEDDLRKKMLEDIRKGELKIPA